MSAERHGDKLLVGQVLDETDLVTLADLCRSCTVETHTVTTLVAEGILDPMGGDVAFRSWSALRLHHRLSRDHVGKVRLYFCWA